MFKLIYCIKFFNLLDILYYTNSYIIYFFSNDLSHFDFKYFYFMYTYIKNTIIIFFYTSTLFFNIFKYLYFINNNKYIYYKITIGSIFFFKFNMDLRYNYFFNLHNYKNNFFIGFFISFYVPSVLISFFDDYVFINFMPEFFLKKNYNYTFFLKSYWS